MHRAYRKTGQAVLSTVILLGTTQLLPGQITVARGAIAPGDSAFIAGQVVTATGVPVPSVVLTLAGSSGAQVVTGSDGSFSFSGLPVGGSYTITPTYLQGNTFSPPRVVIPALDSHVAFAFTLTNCVSGANASGNNVVSATPAASTISADGFPGSAVSTLLTLSVIAANTCGWTMTMPDAWIVGKPGDVHVLQGTGSQPVTLAVSPNSTGAIRSSVISIGGFPYTITQLPYLQVFGTGMSQNKPTIVLLPDGSNDPHYTLVATPQGSTSANVYVVNSNLNPFPYWFTGGNAKWISPEIPVTGQGLSGIAPGNYKYETTFDLTGYDLTKVTMSGFWGADDTGTMKLNGSVVSTALLNSAQCPGGLSTPNGFQCPTPFSITSGFVPGINTLTFEVTNYLTVNNPSGLYVDISASGPPTVPDFSVGASPLSQGGLVGKPDRETMRATELWLRRLKPAPTDGLREWLRTKVRGDTLISSLKFSSFAIRSSPQAGLSRVHLSRPVEGRAVKTRRRRNPLPYGRGSVGGAFSSLLVARRAMGHSVENPPAEEPPP